MSRINISLLGPVAATIGDKPIAHFTYAKVAALLAYLASERGPTPGRNSPTSSGRMCRLGTRGRASARPSPPFGRCSATARQPKASSPSSRHPGSR